MLDSPVVDLEYWAENKRLFVVAFQEEDYKFISYRTNRWLRTKTPFRCGSFGWFHVGIIIFTTWMDQRTRN